MACCPLNCRKIIGHHLRINHHHRSPPPIYSCAATTTNLITSSFSSYSYSSFKLNHRNSFPSKRNSLSGRCHATGPKSEPPSEKHLSPISGVTMSFTRFQDTLRIFFAVLFWMSLFFWSSIWDGGNGGRPNKPSQFRK